MKINRCLATAALSLPLIAHAHPGHDGDHDFVWDFAHLTGHPLATLLGFGMLVAAIWGVRQFRQARRAQAAARVRRR